MALKTRQYAKIDENSIKSVQLSLATSEDIKEWSHGEVTKPETINYKSYKPERGGLFDEIIFGPTTDYKCPVCGTKYKKSNEGQICEKTDECKAIQPEILPKSSRRTRMGHIHLASPVVHFWYFKIDHSIIAKLLGLKIEGTNKKHSKSSIEKLIYFKSHIVLESDDIKSLPKNRIIDIADAAVIYRNALSEIQERYEKGSIEYQDISEAIDNIESEAASKNGQDHGIDFYEYNQIIESYSDAKISTGAIAIEYLLKNLDIVKEIKVIKALISKINHQLQDSDKINKKSSKIGDRTKLYKRLTVLNSLRKSGQKPTDLLIYDLPVIPADLRPLIQIDGGRHSSSDVNELYRRIIIRNNRLKKWYELDAPQLIIQNELRMLQEAVDALIDNNRKKPSPVMSKDNRPLKSISDALSGKKGRFRQNLLGKRVDYSGRSVIVVGPDLKMHQAGIPRQMAAKLFEPWIIHELVKAEITSSIKSAKKLIEAEDNKIWPFVAKAIEGKVVLLNRAPTLHRLSIQAFEPVLVRGKAIKLHALVTTAFNADFDGDQMAIHVPIAPEAIREAKELMLANKNILGPKDGEPIINPSQDMILGLFYLTKEIAGAKGEGTFYAGYDEVIKAHEGGHLDLHARIILPANKLDKDYLEGEVNKYVITTPGKFIFNKSFPKNFPYIFDKTKESLKHNYSKFIYDNGQNLREIIKSLPIEKALTKKEIAKVARLVFDSYATEIAKEDLADSIKVFLAERPHDTILLFENLEDHDGNKLNVTHCQILSEKLNHRFNELKKVILKKNHNVERVLEISEKAELLEKVWFDYTNVVAESLDNLKDLGFKYSMLSGVTMSIDDIKQSGIKKEKIQEGEDYVSGLAKYHEKGLITDDERYSLVIRRWAEIKNQVQNDLKEIANTSDYNPIFMMMESGARSNISNFVQLAGFRGLMANSKKIRKSDSTNKILVRNTIEVPVKSSFLEGLSAFEFYSSTHGARKGLTDTALNTAQSGYLTRRLVDMSQNIIVKMDDCGSDNGFVVRDIVDTKTRQTIVSLFERIEGRYTNKAVLDDKGNVLVPYDTLITQEHIAILEKAQVKEVEIRSVFGCHAPDGVCKKCYGKDLATNRVVQVGEAVGIVAAQSIGEPGTQLTMRTFHTGGVAGVEDITGGFDRLKQLIDATQETWEKPAIISRINGQVVKIDYAQKGKKNEIDNSKKIIFVKSNVEREGIVEYPYDLTRRERVQVGDQVIVGQKLIEGPIAVHDLLEVAGPKAVQSYLLKEIQRLYRMQGIAISDKYVEIIIRQMLSKILIQDPGDSTFFAGSLVDINDYRLENQKLLLKNKKPSYGKIVIRGAKHIPLLSNSFLAAASYQETAKVIVHAALSSKKDSLDGLKENIILGHKIPAGTASRYEEKGKYDLRDPESYFANSSMPREYANEFNQEELASFAPESTLEF